jgi:chitinase
MHYEVKALLDQNPNLNPIWDQGAAVKYLVYGDGRQWISYDDADTFRQKRNFAKSLGMGGAMIWASDAGEHDLDRAMIYIFTKHISDDDKFTAHAALLDVPASSIKHHNTDDALGFSINPDKLTAFIKGSSAKDCKVVQKCMTEGERLFQGGGCPRGQVFVGLKRDDGKACSVRWQINHPLNLPN